MFIVIRLRGVHLGENVSGSVRPWWVLLRGPLLWGDVPLALRVSMWPAPWFLNETHEHLARRHLAEFCQDFAHPHITVIICLRVVTKQVGMATYP